MKKLLEINHAEEVRKTLLVLYTFSVLAISLFFLKTVTEKSLFELGFFIEFGFLVMVLRFYARAHINKNYAFWGLSLVLAAYILMHILHFTFVEYNIFILYVSFLASVFLGINGYVMSSPLYFPRIQWWEYDFRYRGDLKAVANVNGEEKEIRVADLRRECISFMAFSQLKLGETITLDIPFGNKLFTVRGQLRTAREDIPGRPIHYGMKLKASDEKDKKSLGELKKIWYMQKRANIRRKFADYSKE